MKVNAQAAMAAKETLKPFNYETKPLGAYDVRVRITHCGICHSDVHLIDDDWMMSSYPLVPGHEIVGLVEEMGSMVGHLGKGQRVGIGWQRGACHACEWCNRGEENLCAKNEATCVGNHGGFADNIVVDSRFAFPIPDALASENAAPLLCGGITVYSPLRHFGVNPEMKVGVIGIGGLGHLALQFFSAYGCDVTAFSSSASKEKEAREFGAHHFVSSVDADAMANAAGTLDFILNTTTVDLDWVGYVNVLRPHGKLCMVGATPGPITMSVFPLLVGNKSVCASNIGGRAMIQDMLDFAARHKVVAKTETMPLANVNAAIQKVRDNKARYRMVLTA